MSLYKRAYVYQDGSLGYTWVYEFRMAGHRFRGSLGKVSQAEAEVIHAEMLATTSPHGGAGLRRD
jgi:hypothetical protein